MKIAELTAGEFALIEMLRSARPFRLAIGFRNDSIVNGKTGFASWTVTTAPALPEQDPINTGGGRSFDIAWENCHL